MCHESRSGARSRGGGRRAPSDGDPLRIPPPGGRRACVRLGDFVREAAFAAAGPMVVPAYDLELDVQELQPMHELFLVEVPLVTTDAVSGGG